MNKPIRVLLHPQHPKGVEAALRGLKGIELSMPADPGELAVSTAPVLVSFRWAAEYWTDELQWVQSISAGVDQFPVDQFRTRAVVLTSASGVHAVPVAEHALALLLSLTRGIGIAVRDAATATWRPRMGAELAGRTAGVLGLGTLGTAVTRRLAALEMQVIGTRANPDLGHPVAEAVFSPSQTVDVCRRSDVVISTLPGGATTRHAMGRPEFEALGAGWFVNVGRGTTVDEAALLAALDHGGLRGAGLDVVEEEPLAPDSPLWRHPRVVLTPHTAGLSPAYGDRLAAIMRRNLAAFAGRGPWVNRVT